MKRGVLLSLLAALAAAAQVAERANQHYQTPEQRRQMADAFLRPGRDRQQRTAELIRSIGIRPGMTVADVGTGAGYLLPFLSEAVGPGGRVLAEDVFPDFLERARRHAEEARLSNVELVQGTETDCRLPAHRVDVALLLDVYHHFNYPQRMLASLHRCLARRGRLVVVEYYRRAGALGAGDYALEHVRADQPEFVAEITAAGFRLLEEHDHVPGSQYVLSFRLAGRPVRKAHRHNY